MNIVAIKKMVQYRRHVSKSIYFNIMPSVIDKMNQDSVFKLLLIALFAKVAYIDHEINIAELSEFEKIFIKKTNVNNNLFTSMVNALNDRCGILTYANQINNLYNDCLNLKEEIIMGLFYYAAVDGPINVKEMYVLKKIVNVMEFDKVLLHFALKESMKFRAKSAYDILNIERGSKITDKFLKNSYYSKIRLYHPDSNKNIAPEVIGFTGEHVVAIKNAYKILQKRL